MKNKKIILLCILLFMFSVLVAQIVKPYVDNLKCASCGACEIYCPVKAIEIIDGNAVIDYDKCINCKFCIKVCVYGAVK